MRKIVLIQRLKKNLVQTFGHFLFILMQCSADASAFSNSLFPSSLHTIKEQKKKPTARKLLSQQLIQWPLLMCTSTLSYRSSLSSILAPATPSPLLPFVSSYLRLAFAALKAKYGRYAAERFEYRTWSLGSSRMASL
jgi:hypothetical protein